MASEAMLPHPCTVKVKAHLPESEVIFKHIILFFDVSEGRSEYWILYDYMLYNVKEQLHTSPSGGGMTIDFNQMSKR